MDSSPSLESELNQLIHVNARRRQLLSAKALRRSVASRKLSVGVTIAACGVLYCLIWSVFAGLSMQMTEVGSVCTLVVATGSSVLVRLRAERRELLEAVRSHHLFRATLCSWLTGDYTEELSQEDMLRLSRQSQHLAVSYSRYLNAYE